MLHYQPSLAKPGMRIWSSSNDWAQPGRRESAAPEMPRCQVDVRTALPGRHPRTSVLAPKIPSLTRLTGRQSHRIPPRSTLNPKRKTNMLAFLRFAARDFQAAKPRVWQVRCNSARRVR